MIGGVVAKAHGEGAGEGAVTEHASGAGAAGEELDGAGIAGGGGGDFHGAERPCGERTGGIKGDAEGELQVDRVAAAGGEEGSVGIVDGLSLIHI